MELNAWSEKVLENKEINNTVSVNCNVVQKVLHTEKKKERTDSEDGWSRESVSKEVKFLVDSKHQKLANQAERCR